MEKKTNYIKFCWHKFWSMDKSIGKYVVKLAAEALPVFKILVVGRKKNFKVQERKEKEVKQKHSTFGEKKAPG